MKTIDEKAEDYADRVSLEPNTYRGDVVTAYVCGAAETLAELEKAKFSQECKSYRLLAAKLTQAEKEREEPRESSTPRYDSKKFKPPFRVGRRQGKAVLDANGLLVVFFIHSYEQAKMYCDYLNEV